MRTAGPTWRGGSVSEIAALPPDERTPENMLAAYEDSDFEKMERDPRRVRRNSSRTPTRPST